MRPLSGLAVVLMAFGACAFGTAVSAGEPAVAPERGKLIGAQISTHPDWFKQSFLEIPDDAATAGRMGQHVILFFDSEGCPYCYKMIEENFKQSSYTDFIKENFHTIAIDIRGAREIAFNENLRPTEKELARHLNIRFTPTMLFLDSSNDTVLRIDGYRSVEDFKYILDYIHERADVNNNLAEYLEQRTRPAVYTLREHPNFESLTNLSVVKDKPLMVIFEDDTCGGCDAFHDNILSLPTTRRLMEKMTVVRFDARSQQSIVDVAGRATTPARWAQDLDLTYRPGVVMFDDGREIFRIDALRWTFHFQQALRYVVEQQWRHYQTYRDYARDDRDAILDSGRDINVRK